MSPTYFPCKELKVMGLTYDVTQFVTLPLTVFDVTLVKSTV